MKELKIDNYIITTPIIEILRLAQSQLTNGKLATIIEKGEDISVPCPFHKEGRESHNSCYVYCGDGDLPLGSYHCFTCGKSGPLYEFIGLCFDKNSEFGKRWLISNFGDLSSESDLVLEAIDLSKNDKKEFDMSVFNQFESYHPYMTKRGLIDEVIDKFEIKYDPLSKSIVFPVRDKNGKMSYLTRRSTEGKKFYIDSGADKSNIYLLYNILQNNLDNVYICESQINALILEGYGYNAVALLGAGCPDGQIKELNNTGVRHYILALDNDEAGIKGNIKLCNKLSKNKFVDVVLFNDKRDIGELTREEFDSLKKVDRSEYISLQRSKNII